MALVLTKITVLVEWHSNRFQELELMDIAPL
jgi:hypothetical protein